MSDRICLRGLRVHGRHGVYEFEREQGQDFLVDVDLELDLVAAGASDDVADTLHYGELADRLVAIVAASACLTDGRVTAVTVTVHKPSAPIPHTFADVSVTVRRLQARART